MGISFIGRSDILDPPVFGKMQARKAWVRIMQGQGSPADTQVCRHEYHRAREAGEPIWEAPVGSYWPPCLPVDALEEVG